MVELTVGYVAGFIALAMFLGKLTRAYYISSERGLTRFRQSKFGAQTQSSSFWLDFFCETRTLQLLGKYLRPPSMNKHL